MNAIMTKKVLVAACAAALALAAAAMPTRSELT